MFKVGEHELTPYGSPTYAAGTVRAVIITEESVQELAEKLGTGDLVWGNDAALEMHSNFGILSIEVLIEEHLAKIAWHASPVGPGVQAELQAQIDRLKAENETLADALLELGDIIGGGPEEAEESNG